MLPPHLRLKRSQDFYAVRQSGRRWRGKLISLSVLPSGLPHSRYGFVASRSVGAAVVRNRVKRRLRAAVRNLLPHLTEGYDVVTIAHPPAAEATFQELEEMLVSLCHQAGLLASNRRATRT
ncbi:MAG: ribonuclease P protein component [Chloroflexota bacterium]